MPRLVGRPGDGQKAGAVMAFTRENAQALGRRGGETTNSRHGRDHYRQAGALGFTATVEKHWHGDRERYTAFLRDKGLLVACDREFALMTDLYRERGLL
jgi:general stress protein YciG